MLWLADDVFTIHHGWLEEFAAEMGRRGIRIPFECISRADRIIPRVADLLAALGCFRIWIGSESGSQRVLDAMQRGVTVGTGADGCRFVQIPGIPDGNVSDVGLRRRKSSRTSKQRCVTSGKRNRAYFLIDSLAYPIWGNSIF